MSVTVWQKYRKELKDRKLCRGKKKLVGDVVVQICSDFSYLKAPWKILKPLNDESM